MTRAFLMATLALAALLGGCARLPDTGVTTFKAETLTAVQRHLLASKPELDRFRVRGPFEVRVEEDVKLQLSPTETVEADVYLSSHPDPAPLVLLLHGFRNSKEDHAYQAYHLASWGLDSISLQLPNEGPWVDNGKTLARIASLLARRPDLVDTKIDPRRIVLAGHSFGGSAVAIALADGAPAVGGILLDPAGIGRELTAYLRKIQKLPVMVVASDARVNVMRQRGRFYELIRSDVAEVSVKDAHHEDAQFAMEGGLPFFGGYSDATEELQITFVSALTAAALSLGLTGKLDYAWATYMDGVKSGRLFDALRR